jgi:hypothetical protein
MKLGTCITAPEPISAMYFVNPYHRSVCLYVYLPIVARYRLSKHIPAVTNTRNNRRIVGDVVVYAARIVTKESLWVCLCSPESLLGNGSVKASCGKEELLEERISMRSVSYQRNVGG